MNIRTISPAHRRPPSPLQPFAGLFVLLLAGGILFPACRSYLLWDSDRVREMQPRQVTASRYVRFERSYTYTAEGPLTERTHILFAVGRDGAIPEGITTVYDGPMVRLTEFSLRIHLAGGGSDSYYTGDLVPQPQRGYWAFRPGQFRTILLDSLPVPGDMIEVVYDREHGLPQLGISFTPGVLDFPAEAVVFRLRYSADMPVFWRVFNDSLRPVETTSAGERVREFRWFHTVPARSPSPYRALNGAPTVLVTRGQGTWKSYGDEYLRLITPQLQDDGAVAGAVAELAPATTPREKLDRIVRYCQRAIHYEQTDMADGNVIPNPPSATLRERYGDAADCSALIYAMARQIGIPVRLALCRRGTGHAFYPDITVNQFNHMVVHYADKAGDVWYDATNRYGAPGLVTSELINAPALVLEEGRSSLVTIRESDRNLMEISGELRAREGMVSGPLSVRLVDQYAVEFGMNILYTRQDEAQRAALAWLHAHLHPGLNTRDLRWTVTERECRLDMAAEIPGTYTESGPLIQTSGMRLFPLLLQEPAPDSSDTELYFYPTYGRVRIALRYTGLRDAGPSTTTGGANFLVEFAIPPGPFGPGVRPGLAQAYHAARREMARLRTFTRDR